MGLFQGFIVMNVTFNHFKYGSNWTLNYHDGKIQKTPKHLCKWCISFTVAFLSSYLPF